MKQQLDIPLYTKIGPHWAEHIQEAFAKQGSDLNKCVEFSSTFNTGGIRYKITASDRCIVGEPWHLTSKWYNCEMCDEYGMEILLERQETPWKKYAKSLETFAKHYLKKHLGCKL